MITEQLELTSDSEANICYIAGDNDYVSLIVFEDRLLDGEDDKGNPKIAYDWLLSHIDYLGKLVEEKKNENVTVKKFLYQSWIL